MKLPCGNFIIFENQYLTTFFLVISSPLLRPMPSWPRSRLRSVSRDIRYRRGRALSCASRMCGGGWERCGPRRQGDLPPNRFPPAVAQPPVWVLHASGCECVRAAKRGPHLKEAGAASEERPKAARKRSHPNHTPEATVARGFSGQINITRRVFPRGNEEVCPNE